MSTPFHWSAILDQATHRMMMRYHPEVGHLYVPGISARMPHPRGGYTIRTNRDGFRSNVEFVPAPNGKPRILVFGDSFTDGQGVDNAERYSDVLAEMLGASVYNYGISGSAPDAQLLIYEHIARHVQADLIVWGIAVHNIERIRHTHRPSTDRMSGRPVLVPKPYFTLEAGGLQLHHVPVPRVRPELKGDARRYLDEPTDLVLATRLRMPMVYAAARRVFDDWFPNVKHRLRSTIYRTINIQVNEDYSDAGSTGWRLLEALIRRFAQSAGRTPVLVVPLPTYHYCVDKVRPVFDPLFAGLANPQDGLHVLPVTKALVAGRSLGQRLRLFEQEGHYSPEGHTAVAELLAREIARLGLFPDAQTARAAATRRPVSRYAMGLSFDERGGAAVLVQDGVVVAGATEDVFARRHDRGGFPDLAANYCLEEGGIHQGQLAAAGRARHTARRVNQQVIWAAAQSSERAWADLVGDWTRDELHTGRALQDHMRYEGRVLEWPHGAAQCRSALEGCSFDRLALLSLHEAVDGTVATIARGEGPRLHVIKELTGRYSLDDLGRAAARLCGLPAREPFRELAALGGGQHVDAADATALGIVKFTREGFVIESTDENWLADRLRIVKAVDGERSRESIERAAALVVAIAAEVVRVVASMARRETGESRICVAGEVFQAPAVVAAVGSSFGEATVHGLVGHASAAVGAALLTWQHAGGVPTHIARGLPRVAGPAFSSDEIKAFLDTYDFPYRTASEAIPLLRTVLEAGSLIGVFGGRLDLRGPTADTRGILAKGSLEHVAQKLAAHCDDPTTVRTLAVDHKGISGELARNGTGMTAVPLQLRGEPVPLTPFDAYRCMMEGELDALVLEDLVVLKADQPVWAGAAKRPTRDAATRRVDGAWVLGAIRKRAPQLSGGPADPNGYTWTAVDSEGASLGVVLEPSVSRAAVEQLAAAVEPARRRTALGKLLSETLRRSA